MLKHWLRFLFVLVVWVAVSSAQVATRDNYKFGFDTGSHYRRETKGDDGMIRGEYGFRTPDGCLHVTKYEARENGAYKVLGSSKKDCKNGKRRPALPKKITTTERTTTTTTTFKPSTTTTFKPSTTSRTPSTTASKPITTSKPLSIIPQFTTEKPTTIKTTETTTEVPITTEKVTSNKPILLEQISNSIEDTPAPDVQEKSGRQLRKPNLTTRRPTTTTSRPTSTTQKPSKKEDPVYSFGYNAPGHGHSQSGLPDGTKKGEYYFDSPDGWRRIVTYVATKKGFFPKMRRVRIPTTTPKPDPVEQGEPIAKNLDQEIGGVVEEEIELPVDGCPYYFYYNTRIHYHWERCHSDGNKTGEYGRLADDGFQYKTWYYADATGYHPKVTKTKMTPEQENLMAEYSAKTFIIPKPEEERRETEKRIQEWVSQNRDKIDNPLR